MNNKKRIGIIGAGISGLAAARRFKQAGHDVVIFERTAAIGGVWSTTYESATVQNTASQYQFPDFPYPFKVDHHPTKRQMLDYINAFVDEFNLREDIQLVTPILKLAKRPNGGWLFTTGSGRVEAFDHAVVCEGQFSNDPIVPEVANREEYKGQMLHDRQVLDQHVFEGKKVVVVGYGKTAIDLAMLSKTVADETHMVIRTARWPLHEYMLGMHYSFLVFNRINSVMMPCWFHLPFEGTLHRLGMPTSFWNFIGGVVAFESGWKAKDPMRPTMRIQDDFRAATALAPRGFYKAIRSNEIQAHVGTTVASAKPDAVVLDNGETIKSDLVVFATGHKSKFSWLPDEYHHLIEKDGIYLYRHVVHPEIPDMTFIGFNQSFMCMVSADLALMWVLASWSGVMKLPDRETQLKSISDLRAWKHAHAAFEPSRASSVGTRFQQYHDEMCTDLCILPYRKVARWGWWNPLAYLAELFVPYTPVDYFGLFNQFLPKVRCVN
ncbi:hypothetical protein HDU96_010390 [Phlyctochytrium bullatum]|nr:hypothetical protein HDU96_010390 [Phlyctochytrium bullatum]